MRAGSDIELRQAVTPLPPLGGKAELVPGAGSGCGGLFRRRSYGEECEWDGDGDGAATPETLGEDPLPPLPPPLLLPLPLPMPPPPLPGDTWFEARHGKSHGSAIKKNYFFFNV